MYSVNVEDGHFWWNLPWNFQSVRQLYILLFLFCYSSKSAYYSVTVGDSYNFQIPPGLQNLDDILANSK